MIERQIAAKVAAVVAHYGSAVADIHDVHSFLDEQRHDGAGATFVQHVVPALGECFDGVEEIVLRLLVAIDYCLPRILWELGILNNELVQVVTQKVCASVSAVAVEDAKEAALWPIFDVLLRRRLHDVEDDTHAVLVVVPDDALVCVGRVAHDESVLAYAALGRLPARQI